MADKYQILEAVLQAGGPTTKGEIAKRLRLKPRDIQTQVNRMARQGQLAQTGERDFIVTDEGMKCLEEERQRLAAPPVATPPVTAAHPPDERIPEAPPDQPPGPASEQPGAGAQPPVGDAGIGSGKTAPKLMPSEEAAGVTDYQYFFNLCRMVGYSDDTSGLVTRHIWMGGNYDDMDWVWRGLMQMQVRPDLAQRIWHSWRSYFHKAVPENLQDVLGTGKPVTEEKKEAAAATAKGDLPAGRMSHIIRDDIPVYVGEGNGDLDKAEAVRICELRAAAMARGGAGTNAPQNPADFAEQVSKIFTSFREMTGEQTKGKSYLIEQTDEGAQVREINQDEPVVLQREPPPGPMPGRSWMIRPDGTTEEIESGKPTVVYMNPPQAERPAPSKSYVYNQQTGEVKEVEAGAPIILGAAAPQQSMAPVIQFQDPSGNPFQLNLATYFQLEDHKNKVRREEESHEVKMEMAKGVKDLVAKAGRALAHMED
jgi:hypothetical protein